MSRYVRNAEEAPVVVGPSESVRQMRTMVSLWAVGLLVVVIGILNIEYLRNPLLFGPHHWRPIHLRSRMVPSTLTGYHAVFDTTLALDLCEGPAFPVDGYRPRAGDVLRITASGEATWTETALMVFGHPNVTWDADPPRHAITPEGTDHRRMRSTRFPLSKGKAAMLLARLAAPIEDTTCELPHLCGTVVVAVENGVSLAVPKGLLPDSRLYLQLNLPYEVNTRYALKGTWKVHVAAYGESR